MRTKQSHKIIIGIVVLLFLFVGVDFWTGRAYTLSGTIQNTDHHVSHSSSDDGFTRTDVSYYADVSTNENMGMPVSVSISRGQFNSLKSGDEVSVEICRGGITKISYYKRIR